MYAVIKTGGKQYRVKSGEQLRVESLPAEVGSAISFDEVLIVGEGEAVRVGAPLVSGAQVKWTMTPENTMKYADFMASVGTLKQKPATWKDYFFPEIYDQKGS